MKATDKDTKIRLTLQYKQLSMFAVSSAMKYS